MVSVAKGKFSDFWAAIFTEGPVRLYGYGWTEQEAKTELDKKIEEYHATRPQERRTDSANE